VRLGIGGCGQGYGMGRQSKTENCQYIELISAQSKTVHSTLSSTHGEGARAVVRIHAQRKRRLNKKLQSGLDLCELRAIYVNCVLSFSLSHTHSLTLSELSLHRMSACPYFRNTCQCLSAAACCVCVCMMLRGSTRTCTELPPAASFRSRAPPSACPSCGTC
jgi:hypothetical protein